jgi:hypothetical protein
MNSLTSLPARTISVVAIALLVPCVGAVWLMLNPQSISPSTYAVFATLVIATGAVVINTWRNAQAPTSTGQLIYATEIAATGKR